MEKIRSKIKTHEDVKMFCAILFVRVRDNKPISGNPMMDGMIIGDILSTSYIEGLLLMKNLGLVLPGTEQKLDWICRWISANEDELCRFLDEFSLRNPEYFNSNEP